MDAAKERLAAGYSRSAVAYDVLAGQSYLTGLRKLLPLVRIPPGAAILDVGSGTGINLFEAARWFWPARRLCGIDISPGMVQTAQTKAALLGIPAEFTLGDAERLPYPDLAFDLVICNSVLHRIDSIRDHIAGADLRTSLIGGCPDRSGQLRRSSRYRVLGRFPLSRGFVLAGGGTIRPFIRAVALAVQLLNAFRHRHAPAPSGSLVGLMVRLVGLMVRLVGLFTGLVGPNMAWGEFAKPFPG